MSGVWYGEHRYGIVKGPCIGARYRRKDDASVLHEGLAFRELESESEMDLINSRAWRALIKPTIL